MANNKISAGSWKNALSNALKDNTTLKTLNLLGNNIKSGDLPLEEIEAEILIAPSGRGLIFNEELWQSYIRLGVQPGLSGEW